MKKKARNHVAEPSAGAPYINSGVEQTGLEAMSFGPPQKFKLLESTALLRPIVLLEIALICILGER